METSTQPTPILPPKDPKETDSNVEMNVDSVTDESDDDESTKHERELQQTHEQLLDDIKELWENIILPYTTNNEGSQEILTVLGSEGGFHDFVNFVTSNNEIAKQLHGIISKSNEKKMIEDQKENQPPIELRSPSRKIILGKKMDDNKKIIEEAPVVDFFN
jgi:hypothetical protein